MLVFLREYIIILIEKILQGEYSMGFTDEIGIDLGTAKSGLYKRQRRSFK